MPTNSKRKRILYLSYDGMTDQLGQSQVLPYLTGLSRNGYDIQLISFEKPEKFALLRKQIQEICDDAGIVWHPLRYTKKPPVLSTLFDLYRLRKKSVQLSRTSKFDLIHCRSCLTAMVGYHLRKKYHSKLLFDIRGFWADERVEGNIWNLSNPVFRAVYSFMKGQEKKLLTGADAVISLTEKAVPIIRDIQLEKDRSNPLYVIPCCVDTTLFDPSTVSREQQEKTRELLGVSNETFVLTYLGGISTWYLPGEMLDFFKQLLVRFQYAVFLIITQEDSELIYRLAAEKSIPAEKLLVRSAQRKEVPLYLSISNASIFFIKPSFSKQASSPTKQGEIMSMGIPLICNKGIGDTDNIVLKSESGVIVDEFTTEQYKIAVESLQKDVSVEKKSKIRHGAIQYFSLTNGIQSYISIYRKLLD